MPTKIFIWDELSDNVMFETDENNNVQVAYTHRPEKFGEVLYHKTGPRYTYYHYDGNGSTNKLTGDAETVTKTYIFAGFGELIASAGLGSTPFAYKGAAGYYTNPVTNNIYVRARTYEPTTGRWLSKDPLGFVDGPNLYGAYFVPNKVDPSGEQVILVPEIHCLLHCKHSFPDNPDLAADCYRKCATTIPVSNGGCRIDNKDILVACRNNPLVVRAIKRYQQDCYKSSRGVTVIVCVSELGARGRFNCPDNIIELNKPATCATLAHELIHAADHCSKDDTCRYSWPKTPGSCEFHLCTEARAAIFASCCNPDRRAGKTWEECVEWERRSYIDPSAPSSCRWVTLVDRGVLWDRCVPQGCNSEEIACSGIIPPMPQI